jgi:hypothetical protein
MDPSRATLKIHHKNSPLSSKTTLYLYPLCLRVEKRGLYEGFFYSPTGLSLDLKDFFIEKDKGCSFTTDVYLGRKFFICKDCFR